MDRKSAMYGAAQTLLLCAFAGVYFLDRSAWLWPRGGLSGILGTAFCAAGLLLVVSAIVTLRRVIQIAPDGRRTRGHFEGRTFVPTAGAATAKRARREHERPPVRIAARRRR